MTELLDGLTWGTPSIFLIAALVAAVARAYGWRVLGFATRAAIASTLLQCILRLRVPASAPESFIVAAAALAATLVAFLGWIIGRYAQRYLDGEPGQPRFVVALLVTLGAVSAIIVCTNFAVLNAAWVVSSAGLHHLLTFYRDRPAALIVAHKKFLSSRLAEVLLVAAAILLYLQWGTLDILAIDAQARAAGHLPVAATAAAVLIAAAAILKCAQLPLHGWLIQVMEAPTPVSALLHAGVVNVGGYVLIRFGSLMAASPLAQGLLVVIGGLTAALAGVVMLTRITIKVRLAWSTCSQMGFMLMECGLGLYDLALLHLIAHALYKAHAFLMAGEAVRDSLSRVLVAGPLAHPTRRSLFLTFLTLPLALVITTGSAIVWHGAFDAPPLPWIAAVCLASGLATLLWPIAGDGRARSLMAGILAATAGTQIYLAWHWLLGAHLGFVPAPESAALSGFALFVLVALYLVQFIIALRPHGALAIGLYDRIYAGLYLDEWFTRLTFRLWPARLPAVTRGHLADSEFETMRSPA